MRSTDNDPIITTTHGQVRGKLRETVYGDRFYCFDGIPYAKPPLGKLRFRSPEPVEPWLGIRDCTEVAPKCIQYYNDVVEGSEDCLYLNIYAKKLKSEKPLPVMVYIHGGFFKTGTASRLAWGPDYFMMEDVILVTMGYRLGVLGFLSLPEPKLQVPGNAGLKDIVLSLKWLKQNYHNFNGDPENVTLFGHSTGGMAVSMLSWSPQCEGLFHKAILLSGAVVSTETLPNITYRFAKLVGYKGPDDSAEILNYFLGLEAEKLCDFKFLLTSEEIEQDIKYAFRPTVEDVNVTDAVIPKNILDMMSDPKVWSRNIPIMLGATSFEGLFKYNFFMENRHRFDTIKVRPDYLLPLEVKCLCDEETQTVLIKKCIKLHMGDKELNEEHIMDLLHMMSYSGHYHVLHRFLAPRLKHATATTYLYRFDYDSPDFNLYRFKFLGRRDIRGCCHVSEISSLFYIPQSYKLDRDSKDYNMIKHMIGLLTAFAASSDPNIDSVKPVVWEPLSLNGKRKCLNISNENTFIDWPEYEKCKITDQYYIEAGLRLF